MQEISSWIITDGKAGDRMNCLAITSKMGLTPQEKFFQISGGLFKHIPQYLPLPKIYRLTDERSVFAPPFPKMIIASGRIAARFLWEIKKQVPDIYSVFLKRPPRYYHDKFDLIWVPEHDQVSLKSNMIQTLCAPNRFTPEMIENVRIKPLPEFQKFKKLNKIGIVLGDPFQNNMSELQKFKAQLEALIHKDNAFLISFSRRTSEKTMAMVRDVMKDALHWIADHQGNNDHYIQLLANSDHIIVSGDSHNMVSEALLFDRFIQIIMPSSLNKKLYYFLNQLIKKGNVSKFEGNLIEKDIALKDETFIIIDRILKDLEAKSLL